MKIGGEVAESLANNKMPDHMNPLALMAAIAGQQNGSQGSKPQTSQEMTVSSEMINIMMAQSQGQKLEDARSDSAPSTDRVATRMLRRTVFAFTSLLFFRSAARMEALSPAAKAETMTRAQAAANLFIF